MTTDMELCQQRAAYAAVDLRELLEKQRQALAVLALAKQDKLKPDTERAAAVAVAAVGQEIGKQRKVIRRIELELAALREQSRKVRREKLRGWQNDEDRDGKGKVSSGGTGAKRAARAARWCDA